MWFGSRQRLEGPPEPTFRELRGLRDDLLNYPMTLMDRHGHTLQFGVGPGLVPLWVTREPHFLEEALVKNRDSFIKGQVLQWMKPIFGNSILVSEGDHWRKNRRLMAPAFHRKALESYAEIMVRKTDEALDRIIPSQSFAINEWSMVLTLDIVLECLFGAELGAQRAKDVEHALEDALLFADSIVGRLVPLPNWVPSKAQRARKRAMTTLHRVVDEIIADRIARGIDREDLLGLLLSTRDDDGQALPHDEIREEVITLMLAGHETTALNLAYLFMLLGWNQDAQQEVHDELHEVLQGAAPTLSDLARLPKLDAAMKESLRLYPPAAVFSRIAIEDTSVGPWTLPKGAQLMVPVWGLHHDPRWYPEPFTFRLDRWTAEAESKRPKFAYMPFGAGNRICIGDQFAKMESRLLMARILQRFSATTQNQGDPRFKLTITLRAEDKVMVTFHPRTA